VFAAVVQVAWAKIWLKRNKNKSAAEKKPSRKK
jgi:hypothetical protein